MSAEDRRRVFVTRRLPTPIERELAAAYDVTLNAADAPLPRRALRDALRHADALVCTITDRLDADLIEDPQRRTGILANFGAGTDHIALDACRRVGVAVSNTPGVLTDDTADIALLLILAVLRRAGEGERAVRAGTWSGWAPTNMLGTSPRGKVLGIVGMGRIGRAVAARATAALDMRVRFWQPSARDVARAAAAGATPCSSLDELLHGSDVISLHCPATPATHHLIDAERLARCRPSAVLVNTSRGDVVDQRALVRALATGRLAGAGLDVYEDEPAVPAELRALENVVLLPHLGSATRETRCAMGMRVAANVAAFFAGSPLPDIVR